MPTRRLRRALLWTVFTVAGFSGVLFMSLFFSTGMLSNFGAKPDGPRLERMKRSAHFADGRFRNTTGAGAGLRQGSYGSITREYFFGDQVRTPPGPIPIEDPSASWRRTPASGLRATWL